MFSQSSVAMTAQKPLWSEMMSSDDEESESRDMTENAQNHSWSSRTFSVDVENERRDGEDGVPARDSCRASADSHYAGSEVSTDIGEDDDDRDDLLCFDVSKVTRLQRIEQLKRIVNEFANLEFDTVDALSQEGLVMRKLALLKSLGDWSTFYSEEDRFEESKLNLLGLQEHKEVFEEIASRAHHLCEYRQFRSAFNVLHEAAPLMRRAGRDRLSVEEWEAMQARRMQKRQRQREERREQRREDRKNRSAQGSKQ
jgi:hypothetical protein